MSGYIVVASVIFGGIVLVAVAMAARWLFAPQVPTLAKARTYESGVDPVGSGWAQSNVRYFIYAYLYVIFSVDAVFLFPWATVLRDVDLGMASLAEMAIFIAIIMLGLGHAGRHGLLRWM